MKEVDMIIHATKNLEEYRNSVVFKQINIPVMQFRDKSQQQQQQQQQGAKGKKPAQHPQHSQQHEQNVPRPSGQFNQQSGNPNVPTKDKNAPRPPIFGKKEEEKEFVQKPIPPAPFSGPKGPRTQPPVYEQ
jgi:hypothetical protein